jgi:DNA-binding NarL/FixJ family response regulator
VSGARGGAAAAAEAGPGRPIRVLLADDHALFREGVRSLLATQADMEVVGEVEDGRAAVAQALALKPDVVLMDITMPQLDGIEATRQIAQRDAGVRVLVLTMHDNEEVFLRALGAGAAGYVLKRSGGVELMSAIRSTFQGHSYLSPYLAKALMSDYLQRTDRGAAEPVPGKRLSAREQEILKLIAEGHSSREIAEMLDLSVKTVHNHRTRLMTKLDIHRNADLVKYAIRLGMVEVG